MGGSSQLMASPSASMRLDSSRGIWVKPTVTMLTLERSAPAVCRLCSSITLLKGMPVTPTFLPSRSFRLLTPDSAGTSTPVVPV